MLKGLNGESRLAGLSGAAVKVMRIGNTEEEDIPPPDSGTDPAAALARKGGIARAAATTPETQWKK